jgi:3-oxoacyl-[acyl-carrier protein] reductase
MQFLLSRRSAFITNEFFKMNHAIAPSVLPGPVAFAEGFDVAGKRVLVTGAARGIGEYMARLFVAEGAQVLLLDHPSAEASLAAMAAELNCSYLPLDVTNKDSPALLHESIAASFGDARLDAVVHNAGITRDKKFQNMKLENFHAVVDVNLASVARLDEMLFAENWQGNTGSVLNAGSRYMPYKCTVHIINILVLSCWLLMGLCDNRIFRLVVLN